MRAHDKLDVVVPDEPPVLTPELATALLRLLRRAEERVADPEQRHDVAS